MPVEQTGSIDPLVAETTVKRMRAKKVSDVEDK